MSRDCPNAGDGGKTTPRSRSNAPAVSSSQPVVDDWGITNDPPAATTTPTSVARGGTTTSASGDDDWGAAADSWASGSSSKPTTPKESSGTPASTGGDDWGAAADAWSSGLASKSRPASSASKSDDWGSMSTTSAGPRSFGPRTGGGGRGSRACFKVNFY